MNPILLSSFLCLAPGFQEGPAGAALDDAEFRRRFEDAFEAEDLAVIEALVQENPTRFVPLFEVYQRTWIGAVGEPQGEELLALERARVLAEAVDTALEAPGLLEVLEAIGAFDATQRSVWEEARKLREDARAHLDGGRYGEALPPLRQSAEHFENLGDPLQAAASWTEAAGALQGLSRFQEALEPRARALALSELVGDPLRIARSLNNLGNCCAGLGEFEKALGLHERALAVEEASGSSRDVATSLHNLGACYQSLGQPERAIELHERALGLREDLGNPRDIAYSLNNLGACYRDLGRLEEALDLHQRALALRESLDNPREVSRSLNNLGACCQALGQLEKALDFHQRALALQESLGNPHEIAGSPDQLGSCHRDLGQFEKALGLHQRALALREGLGNPEDITSSLNNLGLCYESLGRLEEAAACYERVLTFEETLPNPQNLAASLGNLGNCHYRCGRYEEAIELLERARALEETHDNPQDLARILLSLGSCYQELGQHHRTLESYQSALTLFQTSGNPLEVATSLHNIGDFHRRRGQFEEALDSFRASFTALEAVSLRSLSPRDQSDFRQQYVQWLVRALIAALQVPEDSASLAAAFWITESVRSRALLGELAARSESVLEGADPSLRTRREQLLAGLETCRLQLERAPPASEADAQALRTELHAREEQLAAVTAQLRRRSPRLMELALPEASGVEVLRAEVLAPQQALLQYVLAPDRSFLWLVTPEHLSLHALPGEEELRGAYERLGAALSLDPVGDAGFLAPARDLYEKLVEPVEDLLASSRELIVVADGFLGFLPFEVLLTEDFPGAGPPDLARLPYLLREKTLVYAPSASFLVFQAHEVRGSHGWKKDAVLFGDPVGHGEGSGLPARSRFAPGSFDRLYGTREEVTEIAAGLVEDHEAARLLPELRALQREQGRSGSVHGARFDLYLGAEVNATRLQSDLTGYRILHLATHGYLDPEYPWFSGLVLSAAEGDSGFLNLLELGTLRLDAQIVFLSACDTGTGPVLRSEGIQSTARSFLLAGARAVIATQRPVRDDVASSVARTFYRLLLEGRSPALALHQAKLALLDGPSPAPALHAPPPARGGRLVGEDAGPEAPSNLHAHPALWSPFVIFGGLEPSTSR